VGLFGHVSKKIVQQLRFHVLRYAKKIVKNEQNIED